MALSFDPAEIAGALRKNLDDFHTDVQSKTVGRVAEVGDGIARVSGLPNASVNEMLRFADGTIGLALNLDEDTIGAVILGNADAILEDLAWLGLHWEQPVLRQSERFEIYASYSNR
ncbi:MAG: glutamate--tRNA ligase family protein, partial [Actinomycetota bacterium]